MILTRSDKISKMKLFGKSVEYKRKCSSRISKRCSSHSRGGNATRKTLSSSKENANVFKRAEFKKGSSCISCLPEEFSLIFTLFQIFGIEVLINVENGNVHPLEKKYKESMKTIVTRKLRIAVKLFILVIFFLKSTIQILRLTFSQDKRNEFTNLVIVVLLQIFYSSLFKQSVMLFRLTEYLSKILIMMPPVNFKNEKYSIAACFLVIEIAASFAVLYRSFMGNHLINIEKKHFIEINPIRKMMSLNPWYIFLVIQMVELVFFHIASSVILLFVIYYTQTCRYLRILYKRFICQFNERCSLEELKWMICASRNINNFVGIFDKNLSFHALIAVLFCMIGTFWCGYCLMVFSENMDYEYFFTLMIPSCACLSLQLLIMISGLMVNEMVIRSNCTSQKLRSIKLESSKKVISILSKNFTQENRMTLWKIYPFDRSLIVASLGTLLTYGILFATLGK
ncbi:hypothetical protein AVEN_213283-1 [Araneus ventricosus]|uniref:Gustatory receptor n=1 Tax=Araneus ventricosus TaxID=182803 RepID=A0A4Y2IP59_ARAVE|nr:hypothetical protein AVEN_213283-1 [Araneus ventricosus]